MRVEKGGEFMNGESEKSEKYENDEKVKKE